MQRSDLYDDILAATKRCLERWGWAKTTLGDVAHEARCSRATVYRFFPGGKECLFEQVASLEVERFFASIGDRLDKARDVDELLVGGLTEALCQLGDNAAFGFLFQYDDASLLPHPASSAMVHILAVTKDFLAPHLERWLDPPQARQAADWVVRIAFSYAVAPVESPAADDPLGVRCMVHKLLAPAISRLAPTSHRYPEKGPVHDYV